MLGLLGCLNLGTPSHSSGASAGSPVDLFLRLFQC